MDKNLIQRIISGLIYGFVILLGTSPLGQTWLHSVFPGIQQKYLFYGLNTFFLAVGIWECINIMHFDPKSWEKWLVYPVSALLYYRYSKKFFSNSLFLDFTISDFLAFCAVGIAVVTLFRFTKELYQENGKLIFTVLYLAVPFSLALAIPTISTDETGTFFGWEIFMLFVLIWSSDSFAYFTGRFFGKHKMAPKISPKKTWEGFAGGVILTIAAGFFVEKYFPEMRGNWIIIGFLVSVFAPLGDLVESQLKRSFGVKDSGKIIPGHGGILDRLDSFIICVPVVYLYLVLDRLF